MRRAVIFVLMTGACGPILGVEAITIDEGAGEVDNDGGMDGGRSGTDTGSETQADSAVDAAPDAPVVDGCVPAEEQCDEVDRNCNGVRGIDEPAVKPPAGTMSCAFFFRCAAPKRGAIYYKAGTGFTNVLDGMGGYDWIGYAPQGDFSEQTFPPGYFRIAKGDTDDTIGPVSTSTACCPGGCPTANTFFDGNGQYYTPPPGP